MSFPFGVYIHFPFCLARCGYCDFSSLACPPERIPHQRYARAVEAELEGRAAGYAAGRLRSIYVGGGTPSLWRPGELHAVLRAVRQAFRAEPDLEVTVEVNPGTLSASGFEALLLAGVNRISLGVQTLDDQALVRLGRIHDAGQARRAVRDARAAGVENLSCDLMAGLPAQTLAHHRAGLEELLRLSPDHVSVYALGLSREAPLRQAGLGPAPAELLAEMLEAGAALLEEAGLPQYEVSNFAPSKHQSRHNALVWEGWPYLGLGASAHSMWAEGSSTSRVKNPGLTQYLLGAGRVSAAGLPRLAGAELEVVDEAGSRNELLFLGLRTTRGVSRDRYRDRFGADPLDHHAPVLHGLEAAGWIAILPDRIAPTARGIWVADELALRLMS